MFKNWLFLLLLLRSFSTNAQTLSPLPGEMIVQLKPKYSFQSLLQHKANLALAIKTYRQISADQNIYLVYFDPTQKANGDLFEAFQTYSQVLMARPNYPIQTRATPSDPNYDRQWNLDLIQAPEAWDITTGGTTLEKDTIVVAIMDTGFNIDHEDMKENIWHNSEELPGNGKDDDNNGYTDDYRGWNFANNSPNHASSSHGHRAASIIGASGNNGKGIAGVSWQVKLLPITISNEAHAIEAFDYLIALRKKYNETQGTAGAFIVVNSNSWGLPNRFCQTDDFWKSLHDRLGAVGILTAGATSNNNINVDEEGDVPSTCTSDFLITVLNSTQADKKHTQTGYSKVSIDLAAPGENSAALGLNSDYQSFSGTSAAAPHVAGAIALLYSLPCAGLAEDALSRPAETALQIRQAILDGVDPIAGLEDFTVTGGRLNVLKAMEGLQANCGNEPAPFAIQKIYPNPTWNWLNIEFSVPDFEKAYPLAIYNMLGQLIFSDQVKAARFGEIRYALDVTQFSPGAYVIVFGEEGNTINRKVVIH
ncbi:MAG: S8/S53 family peptidase [Saprospiraceae bacterium]